MKCQQLVYLAVFHLSFWTWLFITTMGLSSSITLGIDNEPVREKNQASGLYNIETIETIILRDGKRGKDLQMRLSFPKESGNYPIIVWSHGMYGSKDGYQPLVQYWVSHGYVVIQPTHSDSLSLDSQEDRLKTLANLKTDRVQDWMNRPRDIQFVLDSLEELAKQVPKLAERMDRNRMGVGGHSYGGFTTQLLAGTKVHLLGKEQSFADPRPSAFVVISGNGIGTLFDKESFGGVNRPAQFISGTHDDGRNGEKADEWRKQGFEYAPPGNKYLVWIEDAYHDFGGISGAPASFVKLAGVRMGGSNPLHVDLVRKATLSFWDSYLKQDKEARTYLDSDKLEELSKNTLKLSRK